MKQLAQALFGVLFVTTALLVIAPSRPFPIEPPVPTTATATTTPETTTPLSTAASSTNVGYGTTGSATAAATTTSAVPPPPGSDGDDRLIWNLKHPSPSAEDSVAAVVFAAGYYALMLFGIVTGSIYTALDKANQDAPVSLGTIVRYGFTPATWQGMLISPLIFGILVAAGVTDSLHWATALLAFQNGFFWRATMQRVRQQHPAAAPAPQPPSNS